MSTIACTRPAADKNAVLRQVEKLRQVFFQRQLRNGKWLSGVRFTCERRVETEAGVYYEKWRSRWPSTAVCNLMAVGTESPVLELSESAWLARELEMAPAAYGISVVVKHRVLRLPRLRGVPLADYLESTPCLESRYAAVVSAARELRRLHGREETAPGGEKRSFSHGNAHAGHVLFHETGGGAIWFNFETAHRSGLVSDIRQADDWRAFAFSVARYFHPGELPRLAKLLRWECPDAGVRRELCRMIQTYFRQPSVSHLAQAQMDYPRHQLFCKALKLEMSEARETAAGRTATPIMAPLAG